MIKEKESGQRQFYAENLLEKLKKAHESLATPRLYMGRRAEEIVLSMIAKGELFRAGLEEIYTQQTLQGRELGRVVIVAVLDEVGLAEVEQHLHLFSEVFAINLTISTEEASRSMKVSPLRKKLRGFFEISMNFVAFIDSVYQINRSLQGAQTEFMEGLSSFLLSPPKFHQFLINFPKNDRHRKLAKSFEHILGKKLQILQRHQSSQYKISPSPRLKILIIDRQIDVMSPLIYSYFYGSIFSEMNILAGEADLTTRSALFSQLYSMDLQEASEFLSQIVNEKSKIKKQSMENKEVAQMKKAITTFCDQSSTSKELQIHINSFSSIEDFCKRRAMTTTLQQTIVNNISQDDQQMSISKIIDKMGEWASMPLEQFKPSEDDYIKMLILTYLVNSLWFFQRRIINACVDGERKNQIIAFCKRVQGKFKPLKQKQQGQERFDLYRHQPTAIKIISDWLSNQNIFEEIQINKSSANRESKYVIAFKGPLGYNQLSFMKRLIKQKNMQDNVSIVCQRLVTTKEYLNFMLEGKII